MAPCKGERSILVVQYHGIVNYKRKIQFVLFLMIEGALRFTRPCDSPHSYIREFKTCKANHFWTMNHKHLFPKSGSMAQHKACIKGSKLTGSLTWGHGENLVEVTLGSSPGSENQPTYFIYQVSQFLSSGKWKL